MKTRRIRVNVGDLFLAPFDAKNDAVYSKEWTHQWIPQQKEECFLMMNISSKRSSDSPVLVALFDKVYHYDIDTDNIDVSILKVLAIVNVIPVSFNVGSFKKIGNQLIPENMPYMAYKIPHIPVNYITPYVSENRNMIEYTGNVDNIPRAGLSVTGGYMYWLANYFIKNIRSEYLEDDVIDMVRVRPEAAVHKFFPEAKNNPNWVISQLDEEVALQDRENYKALKIK